MTESFTRLWPQRAEGLSAEDVAAAIPPLADDLPADRPFLTLNMIATVDGRATVAGRSGPLGNPADFELFHALRARADAVMVGAGTVRVESYGPMDQVAVLVSRSLNLDPEVGLLRAPDNRVIVITPSPDGELAPSAAHVEYLREGDLGVALRRLRAEHGIRTVLCEGGPALNATLIPAGLVDELHLVIAPKLAGGVDLLTILTGPRLEPPLELELLTLHESGGYLFTRYGMVAARGGSGTTPRP